MAEFYLTDQLVLHIDTRERLIDNRLLEPYANDKSFDSITEGITFQLPFPKYDFIYIPLRLDSLAYLRYLGLEEWKARRIYDRAKDKAENNNEKFNGVMLFLEIEIQIRRQEVEENSWKDQFIDEVLPFTKDGDELMTYLGFTSDFISDMNRLWQDTKKDSTYMIEYAKEVATKDFESLDILDYMTATLLQRKANINSFEEAAVVYLAALE